MNTAAAGQPRIMDYEELCNSCREMIEDMDRRRWLIGDTALEIETRYGDKTMESFARDIGANQSTVKGYKRVAKFYPPEFRGNLFGDNPNLTYTFYRDALRLETLELATEWLAEVSGEGWSADEAARKLTERLGHQTRESAEGEITGVYTADDGDSVTVDIVVKDAEWIKAGAKVTIRAK